MQHDGRREFLENKSHMSKTQQPNDYTEQELKWIRTIADTVPTSLYVAARGKSLLTPSKFVILCVY